jgi:hypothetical protein
LKHRFPSSPVVASSMVFPEASLMTIFPPMTRLLRVK